MRRLKEIKLYVEVNVIQFLVILKRLQTQWTDVGVERKEKMIDKRFVTYICTLHGSTTSHISSRQRGSYWSICCLIGMAETPLRPLTLVTLYQGIHPKRVKREATTGGKQKKTRVTES